MCLRRPERDCWNESLLSKSSALAGVDCTLHHGVTWTGNSLLDVLADSLTYIRHHWVTTYASDEGNPDGISRAWAFPKLTQVTSTY